MRVYRTRSLYFCVKIIIDPYKFNKPESYLCWFLRQNGMYSDSSLMILQVNVQWGEMIHYDSFSFHISSPIYGSGSSFHTY